MRRFNVQYILSLLQTLVEHFFYREGCLHQRLNHDIIGLRLDPLC